MNASFNESLKMAVVAETKGELPTKEKASDERPAAPRQRRTQEERRTATRKNLIAATIEILQERGAANMTTAEVAERAGLTRGAIQYHFATPKDLLRETVVEIANRMGGMLDVEAARKLDLEERIDYVIDTYWQGYTSPTYMAFTEIAVQGRLDDELRKAVRATLDEIERGRADVWAALFADSGLNRDEIIGWRTALQVMTRGLALSKMISLPDAAVNPQIARFKDMFKHQMGVG